jgi:hypothetical protein
MEALVTVLKSFLSSIINFLPNILGAIVLLLIGWVIGSALGKAIKKIILRYKIDERFVKKPIFKFSELLPSLASLIVYLFFIWAAIEFLAIEALILPFRVVFTFLPKLIGAIVVIVIGYAIAEYVKQQIEKSKVEFSGLIGLLLFLLIIYVAVTLALPLIGIDVTLLNYILLIIIGSFGLGFAIALGLGLKDLVAEWARKYSKKRK